MSTVSRENVFTFRDLRLDVQVGKEMHTIVNNVSGECKSGQTLAILGPSGAGKTSVLNILTLNATSVGSKAYGKCTLNGNQINQALFQKHCVFVEQLDNHRAFLTPRQALRYATDFYRPTATPTEKDDEVSTLLNKLGLDVCADTPVGNLFMQGLSGGQKKRLSVALALVKRPEVLFLDEPTSGLDAAASSNVMQYISQLAKELNIIVIATIHQPSSGIYFAFDRVMVLSRGRVAFFGGPRGSVDYFADIGYPVPELSNPAEHVLDVVNAEFTSPAKVESVLTAWEGKGTLSSKYSADMLSDSLQQDKKVAIVSSDDAKLTGLQEFGYVLKRQAHLALIDPMVYIGRAFGFLMACTFFSIIYIKSMNRTQEQVLNRLWLSMWFAGVPTSMGVVAVFAFQEEFTTINKEVKNGMYSLYNYILSVFVLQVPAMFLLAIFSVGIPGFAIGNMWSPKFFEIVSLYAALYFGYECIARCLSVAFHNPLLGMLTYLNLWFTSFLFAGIMIPADEVIWPFRLFVYILPLFYSVKSVAYLDAIDASYKDAWYCDEAVRSDCLFHYTDSGVKKLPGWTCSQVANGEYNPMWCYGNEGWQILDSLSKNYAAITSEDRIDTNFGCIAVIAAAGFIGFTLFSYMKVGSVSTILDETPPPVKIKEDNTLISTKDKECYTIVTQESINSEIEMA